MKIGFTGTQKGMSDAQKDKLYYVLRTNEVEEFHHGDCIGADEQAHAIAIDCKIPRIVIHPPSDQTKEAFCFSYGSLQGVSVVETRPPAPYLVRNANIVDACDLLVAAPKGLEELRSGTWAAIRYARKINRKRLILDP